MLLIGIGAWCVVIFSIRVALFGNPIYRLLQNASAGTLSDAERIARNASSGSEVDDQAFALLKNFSRLTLLELGVFLLEIALLIYLLVSRTLFGLSIALLAKNMVALGVSMYYARRQSLDRGLLESLRDLPRSVVVMDRLSSLVSALGFVVVFLVAAGFVNAS